MDRGNRYSADKVKIGHSQMSGPLSLSDRYREQMGDPSCPYPVIRNMLEIPGTVASGSIVSGSDIILCVRNEEMTMMLTILGHNE